MKIIAGLVTALGILGSAAGAPGAGAPAPRTFLVFFEHSETNVPSSADALLPQVAEAYKRLGYTALKVACYSDKLKEPQIAQGLTDKRAARIQATLVLYGVPAAAITAKGFGAAEPLVPGATGPVAVSNRRCIITLD